MAAITDLRWLLLLTVAVSPACWPMTFQVTTVEDHFNGHCSDSDCSLRDAVYQANISPGDDTVLLPPGTYTITLKDPDVCDGDEDCYLVSDENGNRSGDFDIRDDLTINGSNSADTIIDAHHNSRIFDIRKGSLILNQLTLRNGYSGPLKETSEGPLYGGGAIHNHTYLLMKHCIIEDSEDSSRNAGGGAILNSGRAIIRNSRLTHNYHSGEIINGSGGAIYNSGTLTLISSQLTGNGVYNSFNHSRGGAVFNSGTLYIRDSMLSSGIAYGQDDSLGGALFNSGSADIRRTVFYANRAVIYGDYPASGSAVYNHSSAYLRMDNVYLSGHSPVSLSSNQPSDNVAIYNGSNAIAVLNHISLISNQTNGIFNLGNLSVKSSLTVLNGSLQNSQQFDCYSSHNIYLRDSLLGDRTDTGCRADLMISESEITHYLEQNSSDQSSIPLWQTTADSPLREATSYCPRRDLVNSDSDPDGNGLCDTGAIESP